MKAERPPCVEGRTYKIRVPTIDAAVYVTVNDRQVDGKKLPFEVFFNSKHADSYAWASTVSRMLSAIMRNSDTFPQYIIEEMMEMHDPRGGYFVPGGKGLKVNSVVAHIGHVLKDHCKELDCWIEPEEEKKARMQALNRDDD